MKKFFFLFLALVLVISIASMGIGCKARETPKSAAKEEAKPAETPTRPAPTTGNGSGGPIVATEINDTITKFLDAFNTNDLDRVMTFFSDEAVYQPGDGKTHRGKSEIRAAFEPQFNGAFGAMRFDERDRLIDAENRKAALRWVSRHDMSKAKSRGLVMPLMQMIARVFLGKRFGWQGVDVFHFDANGKIKGKFSYGWYGSLPHTQRELG